MQQFLNLGLIDRLPSSMLEACDGKITVEECAADISSMGNNETPVSDGLPKEFYSKFFHLFAQGFVEMLNLSFEAGILPPSLRYACLITLAYTDVDNAQLASDILLQCSKISDASCALSTSVHARDVLLYIKTSLVHADDQTCASHDTIRYEMLF